MKTGWLVRWVMVLAIGVLGAAAGAQETKDAPKSSPEEVVKAGIRAFDAGIRSADAAAREKAFDAVMPDEKLMETLFGADAKLVWPRLSEGIKGMRGGTERGKAELDQKGAIISIQLVDVRKEDGSGRYEGVLKVIPKDIPVYRAVVKYEKGAGGSSSYLVVEGKMRFVRGLEEMPAFIEQLKKKG